MNENLNKKNIIFNILFILFIVLIASINDIFMIEAKADEKFNEHSIEKFMNNYFNNSMEKYSVPGAAVVAIKDGNEIFKKGYGYEDMRAEILVDPDKTSFPACSVSKLFTATAILQLYEEGKIDLDKDVDFYISPYKISNKFDRPVTCRNLLTHSSGLDEESELNTATNDKNNIKSQEYFMDNHKPEVIIEPDTICRYSNEGYNLLGYIVEKVSGISYEQYVKEKILEPLNMDKTTIRLKGDSTARGYTYDGEKYSENPLAYQYTSGSSGIIAPVTDMENFIIANLNYGTFNNNSILNFKTIEMMHSKQFSNADALPGMGFGFIRSYRNGMQILKHEGALPSGFTTVLFLIPEDNLGIYIATNSLSALPFDFEQKFLDYFYPENENEFIMTKADLNKDYKKYEGTYRSYDGTSKNNIMKINIFLDPCMDMEIKDNKDGTLTLHEFTEAKEEITTKLVEKDKDIFVREDGRGKFVFRENENGDIIYAFNDVSENSFEKIKFYENRECIISMLIFLTVIYVINSILTIIFSFKRRKYNEYRNRQITFFKRMNLLIGNFNIFGLFGTVVLTVIMILRNDYSLKYILYFFMTLLIISTIMTILNVILSVLFIMKNKGMLREKIYCITLNTSNLLFITFLYYFNVLGYNV